jgi:hypothetical protein
MYEQARKRKKIERTASAAKTISLFINIFFSYLTKSITQNMRPFICMFAVVLCAFVIKVESSYYVYTYDDAESDDDDDEHCCLVRLGENFCLAKPLTRSLVQVDKECQRLGANEKNKNYLNKIIRRLNADTSDKLNDKILIHLKNPIEKDLLDDDLLCLSIENNNNIDLEKCFVELTVKQSRKKFYFSFFFIEFMIYYKGKNKTTDNESQSQQVEVTEPIYIRQGHGVSVRQTYELNLTDFHATNRLQRECWSWYRKYTKDILNHPTKSKKTCVPLNKAHEKCLGELFHKKIDDDELKSLPVGSKLYCENNFQQSKLLGYHRRSDICFLTHYQIYLDHKFTDFLSLADTNKNKHVLRYLANNTKLTNEFQADCNDKKTLNEIKKSFEEEEEQKQKQKQQKQQEKEQQQAEPTAAEDSEE